jgi:hypothetical protein
VRRTLQNDSEAGSTMITNNLSHFAKFAQNQLDKREKRKIELAKTFATAGIIFESKNNGAHLLVKSVHGLIDFYPESGSWFIRQSKTHARGTQTLINYLTQSNQ